MPIHSQVGLHAALFPSVAWFKTGIKNGNFTIGVGGNYRKQSHFNRYAIAGPNALQNLIIPVLHTGEVKLLKDARILSDSKWLREHMHAMNCAYRKAPFFEFYDYKLEKIFQSEGTMLLDLIQASITFLHKSLGIREPLHFVNEIGKDWEDSDNTTYPQVFEEKFGFRSSVSALDLLFNLGPESDTFLYKND